MPMPRVAAAAVFSLCLLAAGSLLAQSDARRLDPTVWGVYADLAGQEWTASFKRRITVEYVDDGDSGRMTFSNSGIGGTTEAVIEPAGAGKLHWREGDRLLEGSIQPDGSVVWSYGPNAFVFPFQHSLSDGLLTVAKVGLENGRYVVADVQGLYKGQRKPLSGAAVAAKGPTAILSGSATPSKQPAARRDAASDAAATADPATPLAAGWGALAALPGHVWRSNATMQDGTRFFIDAFWDTPGEVLRVDNHAGRVVLYALQPDGRIHMRFFKNGVPDSQWDGSGAAAGDGSVEFLTPARNSLTHYRLDDQGRLEQRFSDTTDRKVTMAARYEKAEPTTALAPTGRRLNPLKWGRLSALPGRGEVHESGSVQGFVASSDGQAIYWLQTYQGRANVRGIIRWSERDRAPVYLRTGQVGGYHLPEPDGNDGIFWRRVSANTGSFDEAWLFDSNRLLTASIGRRSETVHNFDQHLKRLSMQQQPGFDEAFRHAEEINLRFDAGLARAQKELADTLASRERAERSSRQTDAWSRAVRQIDGMLNATDAVLQDYVAERQATTDANIATIRQRAAEQRSQQAARSQADRRAAAPSPTSGGSPASTAAPTGVSAPRGSVPAGAAITVEAGRLPAAIPAPAKDNSGQREVFIACEVISFSGTESGAHGRGGALFISAIGRVRLQDNRAPKLEPEYAARVQSQYNRAGVPICETNETLALMEDRIQGWKRGYPTYKHVMTNIDPTL